MHLVHSSVTTITYKISVIISSKCTWTIGDPEPACTSPYDGTKPVILHVLRPEDMHARLNHQLTMCSHIHTCYECLTI